MAKYYPDANPPQWELGVENDEFPALLNNEHYLIGFMKKLQSQPIGKRGQGRVYEGTWQGLDETTRPRDIPSELPNCEESAAIRCRRAAGDIPPPKC